MADDRQATTLDDSAPPPLPARDPHGHKGTFGTVVVVGGCAQRQSEDRAAPARMIGGPAFAAEAALRAGAGLARLLVPEPVVDAAVQIAPSATGLALPVDHGGDVVAHAGAAAMDEALRGCACLAIGPGFGAGDGVTALSLRAVAQDTVPVVVDADAINALALVPDLGADLRAGAVLTPHPGEFERLARSVGVDPGPALRGDDEGRAGGASALARRLGAVVVLKGGRTVVSDGHRTWIHDAPNPALATAGSGDVLTGVIAGLIAAHHRTPIVAGEATVTSEARGGLGLYDGARLGVVAHALAARDWADRRAGATGGLLARELSDLIPTAVQALRG